MKNFKKIVILCSILIWSISLHAQTFKILGNDTINVVDAKKKKQGKWLEFEDSKNVIGFYTNGKRNGIWRIYNYEGELEEEVKYVNGKKALYGSFNGRIRAKFGAKINESTMKNRFHLTFNFFDNTKTDAKYQKVEFDHVLVSKFIWNINKYELQSEVNTGDLQYIKNIEFDVNRKYKIQFKKEGYLV